MPQFRNTSYVLGYHIRKIISIMAGWILRAVLAGQNSTWKQKTSLKYSLQWVSLKGDFKVFYLHFYFKLFSLELVCNIFNISFYHNSSFMTEHFFSEEINMVFPLTSTSLETKCLLYYMDQISLNMI